MCYYFMATIQVRDEGGYRKYLDRSEEVFSNYRGTYLAVDEHPVLLEGEWKPGRAVLIRFNSREDFDAWYRSDDYQEILQYRLASSISDAILIKG
ncbi:MAG: DUF1330 domain-containing protein [Bacteroidota bacterium]